MNTAKNGFAPKLVKTTMGEENPDQNVSNQ
jgi:hypothetical protein